MYSPKGATHEYHFYTKKIDNKINRVLLTSKQVIIDKLKNSEIQRLHVWFTQLRMGSGSLYTKQERII